MSRALVVSVGSGVRLDSRFTMKAELTAENKPAYKSVRNNYFEFRNVARGKTYENKKTVQIGIVFIEKLFVMLLSHTFIIMPKLGVFVLSRAVEKL